MAQINQNQLIGSMVPDVYIKKITLESGGYYQKESNPHIRHPREDKSIQDTSSQAMRVSLDLTVKDSLDDNMMSSWFGEQDFKKYLQLTVVQSTSPLVTKILSASNNAIKLANVKSFTQALVFLTEVLSSIKDLPEFAAWKLTEGDAPQILDLITANTTAHKISLNDIVNGSETLQTQAYESMGTTGGLVYDICHNVNFEVPTSKPSHVSYFAATSIDLDQLSDDFDIFIDNPWVTDLVSGKVAAESVFDGGVLNTKTTIFKNSDGEVWAGPISQDSDGNWWTNTPAAALKEQLTKLVVDNYKIQDFRISEQINKLKLDFADVNNDLFVGPAGFKRLTNNQLLPNTEKSYFTDIGLTIDSQHNAKFFFGLDYKRLVRDNSKYGGLYSEYNEDDLLGAVKIRKLILKRRRVANDRYMLNKLGSPVDMADLFDKDEVPEVLISVTTEGEPVNGNSSLGAIAEIDIQSQLKHYEGTDKTMRYTTDGHYQYGIEMVVEDNSHQLVTDKIKSLGEVKASFDAYAKKATSPQNFDVVANRFTKEFIKEQEKKYEDAPWATPWAKMLISFAITYSFFKKGGLSIKVIKDLFTMTNPETGNPRGIHLVQGLIDKFQHDVARKIGTKLEQRNSSKGTSSALMPQTPPLRVFNIEHFFTKTIDSNFPKKVGYDYLSNGPTEKSDAPGLKPINYSDYTARVDSETLKYYDSVTADINITSNDGTIYNPEDSIDNTKWRYLTPSNIDLGKLGGTCCLAEPFDITKNANVQTAITSLGLSKKSPFGSMNSFFGGGVSTGAKKATIKTSNQTTFNMQSNLIGSMAKFNCTILSTPPTAMAYADSEFMDASIFQEQDQWADASDMMGFEWDTIDIISGSKADLPKTSGEEVVEDPVSLFTYLLTPAMLFGTGMSFSQSQYTLNPAPTVSMKKQTNLFYSAGFYNPRSGNNAIKSLIGNVGLIAAATPALNKISAPSYTSAGGTPLMVQSMVLGLPNQIKSLFLSNLPQVKQNWHASAFDAFKIPLNIPTVALNYKMIKRVEILRGYERDPDGRPLPKKPIWEPFGPRVKAMLEKTNNIAVCRMVDYENVHFGVKKPKGYNLPTYDEYFIMKFGTSKTTVDLTPTQRYSDRVFRELERIDGQVKDVPSEYSTSLPVTSRNFKISKRSVAKVNQP